jgi:hypothetical protein
MSDTKNPNPENDMSTSTTATLPNQGTKYDPELDIVDIARALRKDIKALVKQGFFPGLKVSVRTERYSLGQALNITITGWNGDIANAEWVQRGFDTDGGRIPMYAPGAKKAMDVLETLANQWNYNASDSMTDYYEVNYSVSVAFDHDLQEADAEAKRAAPAKGLAAADKLGEMVAKGTMYALGNHITTQQWDAMTEARQENLLELVRREAKAAAEVVFKDGAELLAAGRTAWLKTLVNTECNAAARRAIEAFGL